MELLNDYATLWPFVVFFCFKTLLFSKTHKGCSLYLCCYSYHCVLFQTIKDIDHWVFPFSSKSIIFSLLFSGESTYVKYILCVILNHEVLRCLKKSWPRAILLSNFSLGVGATLHLSDKRKTLLQILSSVNYLVLRHSLFSFPKW